MRSNFTVVWGHVNNTWHDRPTIEVAFVAANCVVLLITLHVGFLANLFVAWAVHHQKSLQTSNNALLVNLAVIDILRCAIDCPLLLSVVLSARDLGLLFCSAQIASFSLICCVQLLTLACISAERYQAIAHPFKSAERRKRITLWILLTWLVPICISVSCVIFAKDSPVYIRCRGVRMDTFDSYDTFGIYILTPVWCVCLTVIIGFYSRIFLLVRAHGRKIFDKGSFPPPDKKKEDKKQKQEETKTKIKRDRENPQTMNTDTLKPNEKEQTRENPLDLHPTSEELPIATVTDYLDINDPETVTEKSKEVTFKEPPNETPQVLEGIVKTTDHHTFPSANEEVGVSVGDKLCGESGEEDPSDHRDTTSKISPSAKEVGAVESSSHQGTDGQVSGGSTSGEDGEKENRETSPSTGEDGTVVSNAPQDTTGEEGAEEQNAPQETAAESSPETTGAAETTGAPQEEEEEVAGAVCMMPSLAQRERGNAKKESKLAKRSGYIIFTFLIFWIPLIATVLLNHFYYRDANLTVEVFQELELLTVSLVCTTSLTNPIIYAAVNPQFRTEFHNLKSKWKAFFTRS